MPRASVIIPCFNHGHYLGEAVQSVLNQTFPDFEVIIVDDGSTDNTPEVAQAFTDCRIRYVWQENKGLPAARNTGIRASSGEYVAFLDADDWFLPDKLEWQAGFLDEHPGVGIVAGGWIETDEQGRSLQTVEPWHWKPHLGLAECVMGVPVVPSSVQVRRCWLDAVRLFDECLHWREDWDLWLRLVADGCRFEWLPIIVCRYRLSGSNMARNAKRMRDGGLVALDKLYTRPDLPDDVRALRPSALAAVYIDAAFRAYAARDVGAASHNVNRAVEFDPGLLQGNPCRLIEILIGWSSSPIVGDEDAYLDILARHMPVRVTSAKRQVHKAMSNRYMGQVFTAYRLGDWETVRICLVQALRLDPTWLWNRGVLSITARTLLPILRQDKVTEDDHHVEP
ncbi:MAG: glycosyltransferase [Anaerolineae bacterium]|nr:glycosyltransferase [Anaerolineae bacterium]